MSDSIKPGDLVMVVHPTPCCGNTSSIGATGIVELNPLWAIYAHCDACGDIDYDIESFRTIQGGGYHISTLKKIDPPASADDVERVRELEEV